MRPILLRLAASLLVFAPVAAPRAQDLTEKDVVLTLGKPSGEQTVTRKGSGKTSSINCESSSVVSSQLIELFPA